MTISDPTITMDDLTQTLQSSYQTQAVQADVRATITLRPYPSHRYGYVIDRFYGKRSPYGTMGRKQEARAKALLALLEQRVQEALRAAGWRVVAHTLHEQAIWQYQEQDTVAHEQQVTQIAWKIWHGRSPRHGPEKVAHMNAAFLSQFPFPANRWHPVDDDLEIAVEPDAGILRVRRIRHSGNQEQYRSEESQEIAVVGDEEAHQRNPVPAYRRTSRTRLVTFECAWCTQTTIQHRFPSPKPMYCSDVCKDEAARESTRVRVQRLRERRRQENARPALEP